MEHLACTTNRFSMCMMMLEPIKHSEMTESDSASEFPHSDRRLIRFRRAWHVFRILIKTLEENELFSGDID